MPARRFAKPLRYALAGAVVLALVAVLLWPRAQQVDTAPVTRGRVASVVTASGTLSPLVTVQVGSQVSGRVQWLGADFNSAVRKGQVIARIDPSLVQSALEQARANEAAAIAAVQGAEATVADARR
ncbi:MAG TPA: biotin/lipoyl-binding protein, partial [Xanthomonadaceae bacterium]|nr:biotin/lipoyl-binding protein [Xanthomonadaceae bacterium]